MKKILTILFFVGVGVLLLGNRSVSLAISGACAYHGGVNCATPSSNLTAICNDGWDSSVSYYAMSECVAAPYVMPCYYPLSIGCTTEGEYGRLSATAAATGILGSGMDNLAQCRQQVDDYRQKLTGYNQCIADRQSSFDNSLRQQQQAFTQKQNQDQSCRSSYGEFSSFDTQVNRCACADKTEFYDGKCTLSVTVRALEWASSINSLPTTTSILPAGTTTTQQIILYPDRSTSTTTVADLHTFAHIIITRNLKLGDRGSDVALLQNTLESKGFLKYPTGTAKGYFGVLTKKAVIAFQKEAGLAMTGYVGQQTRKALNSN